MKKAKIGSDGLTVIIGCGKLGSSIAKTLSDGGKSVIVIDSSQKALSKLAVDFGGIAMRGDATDVDILDKAQLANATTLLLTTDNDNTNILIAQLAKNRYGIENIIARTYEPEKQSVYDDFQIKTVCPAVLTAKTIYDMMFVSGEETK